MFEIEWLSYTDRILWKLESSEIQKIVLVMETKFYIKNRENKMGTIFKKVTKWVALFLCVFLGSSGAFAQTLTVDGVESTTACPGNPIVLQVTGVPEGISTVDFYRSTDGKNFTIAGSALGSDGVFVFVDDMKQKDYYYYAQFSSTKTNVVTVNQAPADECVSSCHTTSTGEYFNGTDFNPKKEYLNTAPNQVPMPNGVESYFHQHGVKFDSKYNKYAITTDFKDYFGMSPKDNKDGSNNYYWIIDANFTGVPFTYDFLIAESGKYVWGKKYYRFTMKMYMTKKCSNCNLPNEASIKLETGFGSSDSHDNLDIYFYDDATDKKLDSISTRTFQNAAIGPILNKIGCDENGNQRLIRMELYYYGYVDDPNGNFLNNSKPNGQSYASFKPLFQQMGECIDKLAVDYISADVESVCMDNSAACVGDNVLVHAAGFPKGAKYKWEHWNGSQWVSASSKTTQEIEIKVVSLGKEKYRVRDDNNQANVEFFITGKNCKPILPGKILGAKEFCFPSADTFYVDPRDGNPNVGYTWKLTSPDGKEINDRIHYIGKDTVQGGSLKGDTVVVELDPSDVGGNYTLSVYTNQYELKPNGKYEKLPVSDSISTTLTAHKTPDIELLLYRNGELRDTLCPTDKDQIILAKSNAKPNEVEYEYVWESASSIAGHPDSANVVMPWDEACSGNLDKHKIGVTVSLKGVALGCPNYVSKVYDVVGDTSLIIGCDAFDKVLRDTLKAQEAVKNIILKYPTFSAGCDLDPEFQVIVREKVGGNCGEIIKTITTSQSKVDSDLKNNPVSLPAGVYCVEYIVRNDCGKERSCSVDLMIYDVTPPKIDCEDIPDYTTNTSIQGYCEVFPNDTTPLPHLNKPILKDLYGVDGDDENFVEGVFEGRWHTSIIPNPNSSSHRDSFFVRKDKNLLNDPFEIDSTWILWSFSDKWGNTSYCTQLVRVIDDIKPDVHCFSPELGEISTQPEECGISFAYYKDSVLLHDSIPYAFDPCAESVRDSLEAEIHYLELGTKDTILVTKDKFDEIIFLKGKTYLLIWRFYKLNRVTYDDCIQTFTVVDKDPPAFNCLALDPVMVTANYVGASNGDDIFLNYASYYEDKILEGSDYKYIPTLKDKFDDEILRIPSLDEYLDNCDENPKLDIEIRGPGADGVEIYTKKILTLEEFKRNLFYEGVTSILFTFTDADGNSISCEQTVTVVTDQTPATNCPSSSNVTLVADDECAAKLDFDLSKVPTAEVTYLPSGYYFNFRKKVAEKNNIKTVEDVIKFFPNNLSDLTYNTQGFNFKVKPNFKISTFCNVDDILNPTATPGPGVFPGFGPGAMGNSDLTNPNYFTTYFEAVPPLPPFANPQEALLSSVTDGADTYNNSNNKIISTSNSLSTPITVTVYPVRAELVDSTGNVIATAINEYDENKDISPLLSLVPRWYYVDENGKDVNDTSMVYAQVCQYKTTKLTNFTNIKEFSSKSLTKGEYSIIWYFENEKNGDKVASCTTLVSVIDTIAPTVICGDWEKSGTFAADPLTCKLKAEEIEWLKKPTVEELGVSDNCTTDPAKFTISWNRSGFVGNAGSDVALTSPFDIGTTTITWIVTDESNNSSKCVQTINVEDMTPPIPMCLDLDTFHADDGLCEVSAERVNLKEPRVEEKCSSVLPIEYIRYREVDSDGNPIPDGKDAYSDSYELGDTYIKWLISDAVGNDTFCIQKITVIDNQKPIFADCDNLKDLDIELSPTQCVASEDMVRAELGSHSATDNCGDVVEGIPYMHVVSGTPLKPEYANLAFPNFVELPDEFKKDTTYKIIWVFDDNNGNVVACDQNVKISDVTPPNISAVCPADKLMDVNATTECSVDFENLGLKSIEEMMVTDLCDGDIYPELIVHIVDKFGNYQDYKKSLKTGQNEIVGLKFPVTKPGIPHFVEYVYEDKSGNVDICKFEINIVDAIAPVIDCPTSKQGPFAHDPGVCYLSWENLFKMYNRPSATDICDGELWGEGYISNPVINRYEVSCSEYVDGVCMKLDTVLVGHNDEEMDYPVGETLLEYIFTDKTGNSDTCVVSIPVQTGIECPNDTLRPKAELGECVVKFGSLASMLDTLKSYAVDICTDDSILGIWTGRNGGILPKPDFEFLVGDTLKNLVQLQIPLVGSEYYCDVVIIPSHQNPIKPACEIEPLSDFVVTAIEGECEASNESTANVPVPTAIDTCTKATIYGVPFIFGEDTTKVDFSTKIFPTGTTTIHWQFVSPWNLNDTAWCDQNIIVKGNKKFNIDCDVVAPTYHDTILDCGPAKPEELSIDTPWVADPCLEEGHPEYMRKGVPTRMDGLSMTDPFPLGNTQIKWTFTDFTGAVDTFCIQDIEIRSREELIIDCDAIEDVHVEVAEGECTVDAKQVQLPTPQYALHPCLKDENGEPLKIEGVPSRGDKRDLDSSYYVGRTLIIWTFTDTTNTLAQPIDTCHSYVQVGDVNEMPVDCENFPDTLIVLPDDKCELSWADFNFKVKPVVDLCTREIIDPVVSVTGLSEVVEYLEYKTYFVLESGEEVDVLEPTQVAKDTIVKLLNDLTFNLGASTITWEYNFKGTIFSCNQTISVKNKVAPSGGCESVPDELTIVAPSGECEIPTDALVDSLLKMLEPWPVAYDHCDVDKANPIKGKIYFDGKEITSDGSFSLPVGENTVQWVFIDTAINTVGDTCDKTIIIQSDMAPIFDCRSLDTLNFETDKCEYTYEWNNENIPQAKDTCTSEFFAGVGTRSDNKDLNAPYPMGKTIITWTFKSPYSTDSTICEQVVWVRTTAQPLFDCETLDTVQLFVLDGMCDEDVFTYLDTLTYPVAKDSCTGIEIPGIPLTKDSVEFSSESRFYVGDTAKIIWKFFHDSLNVTPKYCDQYVLVTSYNEPIFDCEALQEQDIKFEIAGCDTILGSDAIPTPAAIDYCTKDSVYGVGSRSDGKELNDPFPVGTTTITWLFKSPYSNISAECDQKVVVLSTQTIDFDCEDLDSIYVPIYDVNTCDTSGLILNAPVALHPCPEQSGIAEIKGVPFINKAVTITPNADSTEWTIDKIHVGLHKITWTFTDPSDPATLVDPVKECEQVLQIGDGTNASVDCENYPDTTIVLDPTDCAISWEDMNLNIKPVFDVCSGELLVPTLSRSSGKAIEATLNADGTLKIVAEDFTVGVDTIIWFFESIGAQCEQAILVKDNIAPEFDCENFEPNHLTLTAPSGECEVIASAIYDSLENLFEPWPFAIEKCTGDTIPGRVYLDEISEGNEILKGNSKNIPVGDHKLVWLFIDSLINQIGAICEKDFTLKSDIAPMFDCESLTDLKFDIEGCNTNSLTTDDIPTPQAKDACVDTLIAGVGVRLNADSTIQMDGTEPLPVLGVYPVGTTLIRWTFTSPFSNVEKVCYQNVVVKTTQEIDFDCESLEGEVIRISVNPLTLLSDPEAESSKIDTLHAIHPCPAESGVEFILGVPSIEGQEAFILSSDSTKWTIPALSADTYKVVWTFADTTETMVEPIKRCEQTLIVENLKDTLFCPPGRNQSTITCVTEESLPIFNSFEEFKAAGGWITDHNQFDASSFGYIEDSIGTPYCDQTRYVTYFVLDVRGDKISCTDTIFVKDNEAPVFAEMVDTFTIACDEELPIFEKAQVDDCDPDVKLNLDSVSHQGDNPSECNYYSYTIDYQWTAVDRCNNKSVYPFVLSVVDTIAPTINLPLDWSDTALSNYLKGCLFSVPDFEEDLRSEEVIQDNCSSLDNIKISQYPAAGDTIKKTTTIYITISDPCGKDTVVTKVVYVQERDEILSLEAYDITKCGSDSSAIDLWGQTTRFATGFRYQEYGDTWYPVPSNPVYDCYRDSISEESLVFSDNPLTYYDKFHPGPLDTDKEIQRSLTELKRMSRSGKYIFVAVDTATMCRDTASSYLTINERPRVAIESGIMTICELTTVDSLDLYSYVKCVDDMGSEITNEGWTLGEDVYSFVDSVIMANNEDNLIYFVENACGKTTSEDTYITFCDSIPSTTEDSLKWVGGSEKNLAMLRSEDYKTKDSILLDVRKRFESEAIVINPTPNDPARIWKGEQVVLELNTDYKFDECLWYKVKGYFDYSSEVLKDSLEDEMDELLDIMEYSDLYELFENPEDTSVYYVTLTDGVCPAIPGQLLQVDVLPKLPTAFTPYDKDGMNDVYMEGRAVVIFDRYGAKVFEGDNGWDGTFKGRLADPGVYYSKVFLNSGMSLSGTIEIVKVK